MAGFDKFGNLSRKEWDSATKTQTVTVGQTAYIGLWGGDPNGDDLDVKADNSSICVAHETPLAHPGAYPNWRMFLVTGLRVGVAKVDAFLPGTSMRYSEPVTIKVVGQSKRRMVFFPGERVVNGQTVGKIYVVGGDGEQIEAAGGPPYTAPDRGHTIEPTPAGFYTLGPKQHVVAPVWPHSVIAWGAKLRIVDGECEYVTNVDGGREQWARATGPKGTVTTSQFNEDTKANKNPQMAEVITRVRSLFINPKTGALWSPTWEWNDFGKWGWRLLRNGAPTAYFIHTTPDNEHDTDQKTAFYLANSHGCVHIRPNDRELLTGIGVLVEGASFEVRKYNEVGPP